MLDLPLSYYYRQKKWLLALDSPSAGGGISVGVFQISSTREPIGLGKKKKEHFF